MDLTKLTVNLVPRAYASLLRAAEISGDTKTDTVNRALQLYVALLDEVKNGEEVATVDPAGVVRLVKVDWLKADRKDLTVED